jgi:hypothetical protein
MCQNWVRISSRLSSQTSSYSGRSTHHLESPQPTP